MSRMAKAYNNIGSKIPSYWIKNNYPQQGLLCNIGQYFTKTGTFMALQVKYYIFIFYCLVIYIYDSNNIDI